MFLLLRLLIQLLLLVTSTDPPAAPAAAPAGAMISTAPTIKVTIPIASTSSTIPSASNFKLHLF
jgi:hypothetical protein